MTNANNIAIGICVAIIFALLLVITYQAVPQQTNHVLGIWNQPKNISNGTSLYGALPDTFDNHIMLTSNHPITVDVWDVYDYVPYALNDSYFNQTYVLVTQYTGTTINFWFNDSAGCGGYIYTIAGDGSIIPNVTAIYNPSSIVTGACANSTA